MRDILTFDPDNYEIKNCEIDGYSITYRAFENIQYCRKPVADALIISNKKFVRC